MGCDVMVRSRPSKDKWLRIIGDNYMSLFYKDDK